MPTLKRFFRSFSLRAGALTFFAFASTLIVLRILIFIHAVEMAYGDLHQIINAHTMEIDEAMEHFGTRYTRDLVKNLAQDTEDKGLYLAWKQGDHWVGNLLSWPTLPKSKSEFIELKVPQSDGRGDLNLLVKASYYPKNRILFVGYDLQHVLILRKNLYKVLLENIALALLLSFAISLMLVWLLNRHMSRFNVACSEVMGGNLDYRIRESHSGDEFDKLAANINRMLVWNKALIMTLKDATNAIAHDMRTPLSRLRLDLRALSERTPIDPEIRQQVIGQVERVDSLIEMFENILTIAKAEARAGTELFEVFDLSQLIQDVVDFYEPVIEEKQLTLSLNIPEEHLLIKGDKQLLGQAILNLLDNACKYTPNGGTIVVSLGNSAESTKFDISVKDNGVGIPTALHEKVKERFYRMDHSRTTQGHGLGLSLVNAVAILHGGHLHLEDQNPGLGVTLTLPKR